MKKSMTINIDGNLPLRDNTNPRNYNFSRFRRKRQKTDNETDNRIHVKHEIPSYLLQNTNFYC